MPQPHTVYACGRSSPIAIRVLQGRADLSWHHPGELSLAGSLQRPQRSSSIRQRVAHDPRCGPQDVIDGVNYENTGELGAEMGGKPVQHGLDVAPNAVCPGLQPTDSTLILALNLIGA